MYPYANRDKFYYDVKDERILIVIPYIIGDETISPENPLVLTNEDLYDDGYEIQEALMDSQSFSFQNAISSYVKLRTTYVTNTIGGCWINIYKMIDNDTEHPIPIGQFYADMDASYISQDGKVQEIIMYDALDYIINADPKAVTETYNELSFPVLVKDLREYILDEFGIGYVEQNLINDDISLPKQISDEEIISGSDLIKYIAEMNGVFPHCNKDGDLEWIKLDTGNIHETGLYPGFYPSINSFPGKKYTGTYADVYRNQFKASSTVYANYKTMKPDGIQIRNENNDVAYFLNQEDSLNPYTIINNFLLYGLSQGQYQIIAERLYEQIKDIEYVPFQMAKMSDPCLEVGDRVSVHTEEGFEFVSYIFAKHTKGVIASFEDIQTSGTYALPQFDKNTNTTQAKLKNLDQRVGNVEKSGSGALQIMSVAELPSNPQLNVLYLIQGEVQEV